MLLSYKGIKPRIAETAFVAPDTTLIGDVTVGEDASIWFGARLRGDIGKIVVGARSNVQDNVVIHLEMDGQVIIEEDVTVAHGAVLHNCVLKKGCVVGMNAVVLDNAVVGEGAMIAAGSVVIPGSQIPPRCLATGIPAKPKKELSGGSRPGWNRAPVFTSSWRGVTAGKDDPDVFAGKILLGLELYLFHVYYYPKLCYTTIA